MSTFRNYMFVLDVLSASFHLGMRLQNMDTKSHGCLRLWPSIKMQGTSGIFRGVLSVYLVGLKGRESVISGPVCHNSIQNRLCIRFDHINTRAFQP